MCRFALCGCCSVCLHVCELSVLFTLGCNTKAGRLADDVTMTEKSNSVSDSMKQRPSEGHDIRSTGRHLTI